MAMPNQELIDFVKKQRERGVTPTDIEKALVDVGWSEPDVQDALAGAGIGMAPKPNGPIATASPLSSPISNPTSMSVSTPARTATPAQSKPSISQKPVAMPTAQPEKEPVDVFAEVDATGPTGVVSPTNSVPATASKTPAPLTAAQHAAAPAAVEYQEGMSLKKKIAVFSAIILAVAVIVAGAVFAYFRFYQSPSRIGTLLIGNLAGLTSANVEMTIDQTLKSGNTLIEQSTTTINGDTTVFTSEQPASSLTVQWKNKDNKATQEAGMNFRSTEGKSYLQLTSIEGGGDETTTLFTELLSNQWVVIDTAQGEKSPLVPLFSTNILSTSSALTAEDQGVIRDAFRGTSVLKLTEKIDTAMVDGTKTYHYRFEVDKEGLKSFIGTVAPVLKTHGRTDASISLMVKGVDSWNSIDGELWVGAQDYQLYRVEITATGTRSANRTEVWKATVKVAKHNQPVTVEAPVDAMSIDELIEDAAAASVGEPTTTPDATTPTIDVDTPTDNKKKDVDDDGLTDALERDYGTNATDPDSDDDGFLDGEEVENGYNPLGAGKLETK